MINVSLEQIEIETIHMALVAELRFIREVLQNRRKQRLELQCHKAEIDRQVLIVQRALFLRALIRKICPLRF